MKELQEHSADLALILYKLGYNQVADWLMIAAGIEEVNFKWNRFDKSMDSIYCRPAYESDRDKGLVNKSYILQLTIFNYIWSSFECITKSCFSKSQIRKYGKVNLVLLKLSKNLYISHFKKVDFLFHNTFNEVLSQKLMGFKCSVATNPLKIIYEIRNSFAHGDLEFLESEDNLINANPLELVKLVNQSSRIVLFYIQALSILFDKNIKISLYLDEIFTNFQYLECNYELYPLEYIMSRIHLEKIPYSDLQMTLFGLEYYKLEI